MGKEIKKAGAIDVWCASELAEASRSTDAVNQERYNQLVNNLSVPLKAALVDE